MQLLYIFTFSKTMLVQTKNITDYSLRLLVFICLGHFCVDFMLGIWPVFKTMAGLDIAMAGLLAGSCVVFGEGLQCFFGSLSDRGYERALLFWGIIISGCAALFSYSDSYVAFLLLFLGTCLGSAAFHPTAASLLASLEGSKRSTVMGFFTASGMMGLGISQMLFSWTYESFDGSTAILCLPSILLSVAIVAIFRGNPEPRLAKEKKESLHLFMRFLKVKALRALYFSMLGNQIVLWSLVFLLPDFLKERAYPSWIVYGAGHLALMLGATVGPPILGHFADKSSSRQVIVFASFMTLFLFYLFLLPIEITNNLLFCALFFLGVMMGSVPPLIWALGGQLVPQHRGTISAFLMGFVWIFSEGIGLGLSGYFASLFTTDCAAWALALMGSIQVLSFAASMQIPKNTEEPILA